MPSVHVHISMQRLFEAALQRSDDTPTKVAKRMNVSQQTVTNWADRGISKDGALRAQAVYGCDANWILGQGPKALGSETRELKLDTDLLRSAILVTERALQAQRVTVTTEARSEITLAAYDILREGQAMPSVERMVARMLQAIGGATSVTH